MKDINMKSDNKTKEENSMSIQTASKKENKLRVSKR